MRFAGAQERFRLRIGLAGRGPVAGQRIVVAPDPVEPCGNGARLRAAERLSAGSRNGLAAGALIRSLTRISAASIRHSARASAAVIRFEAPCQMDPARFDWPSRSRASAR